MYKINLGCEGQIIPDFLNFDIRYKQFPGSLYWEWNQPIPCDDNSVGLALVQHALMYCRSSQYDWNLQEIYRVLSPNGVLLLKEEDNKKHQWRKVGTRHKTGHIVSSTNPEEIVPVLERNKFKIINSDPKTIVDKYGDIINRQPKLFKGWLFVVEAQKL